MNFDRSAVSLRLNMDYVDKNNGVEPQQTCYIRGGANFGRQGYDLNKHGRISQDNATNIIPRP